MGLRLVIGLDTESSYLQIIIQFTNMHYDFVICYISVGCWLCCHRHFTRFQALMTGNPLLDHRVSAYHLVAGQLENTILKFPQLLCAYVAVRDWCLTLPTNGSLCKFLQFQDSDFQASRHNTVVFLVMTSYNNCRWFQHFEGIHWYTHTRLYKITI
jgi:hypothetical protein